MYDSIVVGGGLIGLATALSILKSSKNARVLLIEKEETCCFHQSTRNSGVLHAGLAYKPGSLKARLSNLGLQEMVLFCDANDIPYEQCGKLIVASDRKDQVILSELLERGIKNGLNGLKLLTKSEAEEREPHVSCVEALLVPEEGIVDYSKVSAVMVDKIREAGGEILLGTEVQGANDTSSHVAISTSAGVFEGRAAIFCAGLQSDRLAKMCGNKVRSKIVPFRGDYFELKPDRSHLVKHLIYPVADPNFPFLGVHLTRTIDGRILAGPNASLSLSRENYGSLEPNLKDTFEVLTFGGFWNFLRKYPSECASEALKSLSKRVFLQGLQKLIPEISEDDLLPSNACGIRAQAMCPTGGLQMDFEFVRTGRQIHVINAPSPGATASLAIGKTLAQML